MKRTLAILLTASIMMTCAAPAAMADAAATPESAALPILLSEDSTIPQDRIWDLVGAEDLQIVEGQTASYQDIFIDATNGKFAPRDTDTQINAGTILTIPVQANPAGAALVLTLSGGSAAVSVNGNEYTSSDSTVTIPLEASEDPFDCTVKFTQQAYLTQIALQYGEPEAPYPGEVGEVQPLDTEYTFESADALLGQDGAVAPDNKLEGNRGSFADILVNADSGKFNVQPEQARVVINEGTVLYLPVAHDPAGVTLMLAGTQDGSTPSDILVDGVPMTTNTSIDLDMSDAAQYPRYVCIEFKTIAYVTLISLNYASDSDFGTPDVQAKDTVWDLTGSGDVQRPDVQGAKGEYAGIQIDATAGKFTARDGDTQINAGTVLYIPVAPDEKGASITLAGNNYNNLTLLLGGEPIEVGKEAALPQVSENAYIPLSFESADGTGSCYLNAITIDYMSDDTTVEHTVTVGAGGQYDYTSIQAALDANESSAAEPLMLLIAPGTYREKITVDKPWVSFQPMYQDGGEVRIEAGYYSSNTFNEDGSYAPQDEYDVGTDQSGTVLVTASATGFSAVGITFVNTYNLTDHTQPGEQTPAVAFSSAADKIYLSDCRFLGRQDTLYLHGSGCRVMVENSYIEGTVDFIFGDANASFVDCRLHMAYYPGKNNGYYTAPNTKKGNTGLLFYACTLTADEQYSNGGTVSLGRPWQTEIFTETARKPDGSSYLTNYDQDRKNPAYENTASAATFVACTMPDVLTEGRWSIWTRKDKDGKTVDVTYHDDVHFDEVNSLAQDGSPVTADEEKLVLGTMTTVEDSAAHMTDLLTAMGIGEGIGYWDPEVTIHSVPKPVQPEQPVQPDETPVAPSAPASGSDETGTDNSEPAAAQTPVIGTVFPALPVLPAVSGTAAKPQATPAAKGDASEEPSEEADKAQTSTAVTPAPTDKEEEEVIVEEDAPLAQSAESGRGAWYVLPLAGVCVLAAFILLFLARKRRKGENSTDF